MKQVLIPILLLPALFSGCGRSSSPPEQTAAAGKSAEPKISPLTTDDNARLARQEAEALRILQARYGEVKLHHNERDLLLLQRLVDDKVLLPSQTYELQCLGTVLGQVFAAQTPLVWVAIEDEFGRDLALQYPSTTVIVFPLTMISKRVEDGREVEVAGIYKTVAEHVEKLKDDPEFKR